MTRIIKTRVLTHPGVPQDQYKEREGFYCSIGNIYVLYRMELPTLLSIAFISGRAGSMRSGKVEHNRPFTQKNLKEAAQRGARHV